MKRISETFPPHHAVIDPAGGAGEQVIALAGNPNVGKSTVFNALTGLEQHTGNWPGKTVETAQGFYSRMGHHYIMVDLPGTYSLMAHSAEEEVARDFLCFGGADAVIVVCDATCLERNLNLVLQTMEMTKSVVVCVNLCDEAEKKGIRLDLCLLEERLGVPVVGTNARSGGGLDELMAQVAAVAAGKITPHPTQVRYHSVMEQAIETVVQVLGEGNEKIGKRWMALRLLEGDKTLAGSLLLDEDAIHSIHAARCVLQDSGFNPDHFCEELVSCIIHTAQDICQGVLFGTEGADRFDRRLDRILTSRRTGIPVMLLLLGAVFWLTITGANIPSQWLSQGLFWIQDQLSLFFVWMRAPEWLHGVLVLGMYRVLAWVVSVMLPPMAIFFPLFTLLEDFGYLPRIAFNLDHSFQKAHACGKQSLTMCMGYLILY